MNDKPAYKLTPNLVSGALGLILILLGILFLVGRSLTSFFHFDLGHYAWPVFILVPGLLIFLAAFLLERQTGIGLAMLGGVITMTGGILFVQNLFDLYASWAYVWALAVPTAAGLAKVVYGALREIGDESSSTLRATTPGTSSKPASSAAMWRIRTRCGTKSRAGIRACTSAEDRASPGACLGRRCAGFSKPIKFSTLAVRNCERPLG